MPQIKILLQPILDSIEKNKDLPNTPDSDLMYRPEFYPNNELVDKQGRTQAQCDKEGLPFFPDHPQIDASLLPESFALVGDDGVYLMPNKKFPKSEYDKPDEERSLFYAIGGNRNTDPDYYEFKRRVFGGDDGAINIPIDWIRIAEKNKNKYLTINLSAKSISLVSTPPSSKPKTLKPKMQFELNDLRYELVSKAKKRGEWLVREVGGDSNLIASASVLRGANWDISK